MSRKDAYKAYRFRLWHTGASPQNVSFLFYRHQSRLFSEILKSHNNRKHNKFRHRIKRKYTNYLQRCPNCGASLTDLDKKCPACDIDLVGYNEEENIIAILMMNAWLQRQVTSIENIRMKYSGSDFKFTSQANHMQKLLQLKKDYEREGFHLQRLYKRR